jgi:sucrose phosphorylase
MSSEQVEPIMENLGFLYGKEGAEACFSELERIMQVFYAHKTPEMVEDDRNFRRSDWFTEKDVVLITYGDLIKREGGTPLEALISVAEDNDQFGINSIHLLPFFPYSSDRGFSIIDYEEVDPRLGSWDDIEKVGLKYKLMFDGVFNHISAKSKWFQEFLNGNPKFEDYFIKFSTGKAIPEDYRRLILRPRTSNLLTGFDSLRGRKYVWTTFSPDQIDLNFQNEEVLLRIVEILLLYVRRGADIIRLDAVTYMWCELGTTCALLEESHILVRLFRAVLNVVAPQVALITETNVPHEDNISYFGDGSNEAQMVYNFALPPLVLQAFQTEDVRRLSEWAASLDPVSETATYFNFLDSHDGIGLLPVREILEPDEIDEMIRKAQGHGALISYRVDSDGNESPYEINTTWFSALNREDSDEPVELQVARFLASRSIALALMGVPGIYLPSLVGSKNDTDAVLAEGEARSINRAALDEAVLKDRLKDPGTAANQIFSAFGRMIRIRVETPAFHPNAAQEILTGNPAVFSILRIPEPRNQAVLALTNVSDRIQSVSVSLKALGICENEWRDLLSEGGVNADSGTLFVELKPYQIRWLTPADE